MKWPKVTIVTPTLNAASVMKEELESIAKQDYPRDKIEIVVADGGSTDNTRELAKEYGARVVDNPLKTGEAGKAVGVRAATGDFIALIDSDNILPTKNWLKEMIKPLLENSEAVGSEPWKYTWREEDSFITRYSALIGMNDPFVHFLGNYDRMNSLTGKWTEVPHKEEDKGDYLLVTLGNRGVPTIGANGTVFRAEFLKQNLTGDYLFDIDIIAKAIKEQGSVQFIKTKNGIIHTFCEANIGKFARKQRRRVRDFLYHKGVKKDREFDWETGSNLGMVKFLLSCVTVVPLVVQAVKGYSKKPDLAWLFHPLACEITLWEYGWGTVRSLFNRSELSREGWGQ
ncbi:glycosyltransferase [candidate division WWE3 bacterium]|nr:glycosyltransferase [candidate division WWE3 bacterium]